MPSFKGEKLRTNLRLAINRLKLLEKKKTEQAMKARKEIADYIKNHRYERARVRVEHIIREDYLVEALEVLELYCDLLLARFGLLEQKEYCDDTLSEAVATLIWGAPRLSADIQEFSVISHQLEHKFGKPFAQQARSNLAGTVNPKVIHRLGVEPIKKSLVENYMVEIARNYRVDYEPDASAYLDDDGGIPSTMEKPFLPPVDEVPPGGSTPFVPPPGASAPPPANMPPPGPPHGYGAYPGPPSGPMTQPPPPTNSSLPYPTGPQQGQQPPALPQHMDLPPVPNTSFPENSTGSDGGGDVDFDDLTRRFEQLKKKK